MHIPKIKPMLDDEVTSSTPTAPPYTVREDPPIFIPAS